MSTLAAPIGIVAASRRRAAAGTPTVLGYNVKDAGSVSGFAAGRLYVSQYSLASPGTLTELHGWFQQAGANNVRVAIYADSAGSPGARKAYTNLVALGASGDLEVSQSGFSVPLTAGTYWVGFYVVSATSGAAYAGTGGTHKGRLSGAPDPPPDPFGTPDTTGTRKHSCWAIVLV